jgi:tetratricopeptide (TPR) repeat protein
MSSPQNQNSIESYLKDLWNRRFFQFLAAFLGSGWALIQFADWFVVRYDFDSVYVDRLALFLLLFLPAFLVFVYNHGKPGPDDWLFFEKIFIPLSFVIGIFLSYVLLPSKAASYEYIEVENVQGDTIGHFVANRSAVKLLGVFPFKNISQDTSLDFLNLGVAEILERDLMQEFRIYPINPIYLYKDSDFEFEAFFSDLNYTQKLTVAKTFPTDYFVSGTFDVLNDEYSFTYQLVDSKLGEELLNELLVGEDFYDIIDQITLKVIDKLFPSNELKQDMVVDLPARELIASTKDALKNYINGYYKLITLRDAPEAALPYFERAVELDDNCAICHFELGNTKILIDGFKAGIPDIERSVEKAQTLYDRIRFEFQERYYYIKQDYESLEKLLRMIMKLYPYDIQSYSGLIDYYSSNEIDKGLDVAKIAVDRGFGKALNKKIGDIYYKAGRFEEALGYYKEHLSFYPKEKLARERLIDTYMELGEMDEARTLIEESVLLYPSDVQAILKRATFERRIFGNFDLAQDLLQKALAKCESQADSADVYKKMSVLANQRGQALAAITLLEKSKELKYGHEIPVIVDYQNLNTESYLYWEAGLKEQMLDKVSEYTEQHSGIISMTESLFHLDYAQVFEDTAVFFAYYPLYRDSIINFYGSDSKLEIYFDAYYEYFKGKPCEALTLFKDYYEYRGMSMTEVAEMVIYSAINCGNLDEALDLVDGNLKSSPHWPFYNYLKALVLNEKGEKEEAKKYNTIALQLLKDAEENNLILQKVRLLAEVFE